MTPSNSTHTRLPLASAGSGDFLAIPATPDGSQPPEPVVGASWRKSPSMLQSWGTSSLRQPEVSNPGFSAPVASPWKNAQSRSSDSMVRAGAGSSEARRLAASRAIPEEDGFMVAGGFNQGPAWNSVTGTGYFGSGGIRLDCDESTLSMEVLVVYQRACLRIQSPLLPPRVEARCC